jgi:hypothetical protein
MPQTMSKCGKRPQLLKTVGKTYAGQAPVTRFKNGLYLYTVGILRSNIPPI